MSSGHRDPAVSRACALLWPPQHGLRRTSRSPARAPAASSQCGIASIAFASCSVQPARERTRYRGRKLRIGTASTHPAPSSLRAERDGPAARSGARTRRRLSPPTSAATSAPVELVSMFGVFHDRATRRRCTAPTPDRTKNDTRAGINGTYGTGCGGRHLRRDRHWTTTAPTRIPRWRSSRAPRSAWAIWVSKGERRQCQADVDRADARARDDRHEVPRLPAGSDHVVLDSARGGHEAERRRYLDPVLTDGVNHQLQGHGGDQAVAAAITASASVRQTGTVLSTVPVFLHGSGSSVTWRGRSRLAPGIRRPPPWPIRSNRRRSDRFREPPPACRRYFEFMDAFFARAGVGDEHRLPMQFAVEELFTNLVKYSRGGTREIHARPEARRRPARRQPDRLRRGALRHPHRPERRRRSRRQRTASREASASIS